MGAVKRLRFLLGALALVLVVAACGSEALEDSATPAEGTSAPAVADDATDEAEGAQDTDAPVEAGTAEPSDSADEEAEAAAETTTTTDGPAADERPDFGPVSLVPECANLPDVSIGLSTDLVSSGGNDYTYQYTVPSSYDGSPVAVVLDFHGIGSNGAQQAVFSGWAAAAETQGFLSVQPTGLAAAGDDRASWELPQFETDERDDIAFVVDLIDEISSQVCIDPARIYSTGMSNGGLFTSTVVCELSERIAAAVSVAGVTHHESCSPSRAVPYLAFHGTDDTVVPFNGGGESTLDGAEGGSEFFEQVIPEEFAEFAETSGCTESVDSAVTAEITLTSYSGCTDGVPLGFYTIVGGGHTWPGSSISAAIPTLGFTNLDISATEIAWEFFSQHTLDGEAPAEAAG